MRKDCACYESVQRSAGKLESLADIMEAGAQQDLKTGHLIGLAHVIADLSKDLYTAAEGYECDTCKAVKEKTDE